MCKSSSIEHTLPAHRQGGRGGARGEPCARDSCKRRATRDGVGLVNEISWCANPAWVNYANVQAVPRSSRLLHSPPPSTRLYACLHTDQPRTDSGSVHVCDMAKVICCLAE